MRRHRAVALEVPLAGTSAELWAYLDAHLDPGSGAPGLAEPDAVRLRFGAPDDRPARVEASGTEVRVDADTLWLRRGPAVPEHLWCQDVYANLRRYVHASLAPKGLTVLHAAALAWRGAVVLLLGPKGAGKTAAALAAHLHGAAYVGADRVLAWIETGAPGAPGVPWCAGDLGSVRIDVATLDRVDPGGNAGQLRALCAREARREAVVVAGKVRLPPAWFADALGIPLLRFARPAALVELGGPADGAWQLEPAEGAGIVTRATLSAPGGATADALRARLGALPAWRLGGRGPLAAIPALLDRVVGSPS